MIEDYSFLDEYWWFPMLYTKKKVAADFQHLIQYWDLPLIIEITILKQRTEEALVGERLVDK